MDKKTHTTLVKVLAWIAIVFGVLGALGGLAFAIFGSTMMGFMGMNDMMGAGILGGGLVIGIALFIIVLSAVQLVAGIHLLKFKNWARWLLLVLYVLSILSFPIGTVLAILALWVLAIDDNAKKAFN